RAPRPRRRHGHPERPGERQRPKTGRRRPAATGRDHRSVGSHFHTLREGRRALRKTQGKAERAWSAAEEADKKQRRQRRRMKAETGYATQAVLAWRRAEQAFHQWENDEAIL